jgi:hypothetical protein
MSLDVQVWKNLEAHGLTQAHLEMLLRLLETQRNGCLAWHFVHGSMVHCDLRLVFPSRRGEVSRVTEGILRDTSLSQ